MVGQTLPRIGDLVATSQLKQSMSEIVYEFEGALKILECRPKGNLGFTKVSANFSVSDQH